MCRLLFVKKNFEFAIKDYLIKFADISKNSKEYQGHGWGMNYLDSEKWKEYKNINPIWEDANVNETDVETNLLVCHARSAFEDKDIVIENNMPFNDGKYTFIFNGELRGVRINSPGRIGAEKIFNFIKKLGKGDMLSGITRGVEIIRKRTEYIKAMNIIITDGNKCYVYSEYNEDSEYFQMWMRRNSKEIIVCSEKLDDDEEWKKIETKKVMVII